MLAMPLAALGLGFVAGLRAFTAPAALTLTRGPIVAALGIVLAAIEYVMDVRPSTPSRTEARSVALRIVSGGFCGWLVGSPAGIPSGLTAVALGIVGALAGTYGGHAARLWAIGKIGLVPSGVVEDLIAIGLAAFILTR